MSFDYPNHRLQNPFCVAFQQNRCFELNFEASARVFTDQAYFLFNARSDEDRV